jgi:hypothetical protein
VSLELPHWAVIPGRYDGPSLSIDPAINNEAVLHFSEAPTAPTFYSALDLLEAVLAVAWAADQRGTIDVLSRARMRGFEVPDHLRA